MAFSMSGVFHKYLASALALGALLLTSDSAMAGVCGAEGQAACTVFQRVPSCDKNLVEKIGKCVHPACGRQGERPCTVTERIPSCDDVLVEIAGKCLTRGACGGEGERACTVGERVPSCNANLAESGGRCIHPDCGQRFERACTGTERPGVGVSCDSPGLVEVAGCTAADCKGSSGMCYPTTVPPISEPTTNLRQTLPSTDPMRGFADLHVHMFSNLAFGGGVVVGSAYDPAGGIGKALAPDFGTDLDLVSMANTPIGVAKCPPLVPNCGRNVLHALHTFADDTMGAGTSDDTKTYWGAPYFTGWPKWHTTTHQQVYYKWLERAWQGGMRAMVMLAVNNEFACATSKHLRGTNCSWSMPGIDAQLDAAIAFQRWHEAQPGGGWFKIVKSPDEAEQVIRAGKLAVILGIESDTLFGCKLAPHVAGSTNQTFSRQACTPEFVNGEVDKYYAKGVRYIFPVHDFDTAFSGTALFVGAMGGANITITGNAFTSASCPGVSDKLGCNTRGLQPAGPALLNKLMDQGWMIDLDHMSARGIDETFALAKNRGGYPFFIGHGLFNELYATGKNRHERMRTAAQLAQLKAFGSVVSVMTQDELEAGETVCMHSSVSFGQNLNYAASKMDVVAFGSDFNGFAPHVGPRFGPEACGKNASQGHAQGTISTSGLAYPITVPGFATFEKQVTGQRTFDFNTDGLAHIGLYPDLLADLARQGVPTEPLMKSAAAVVTAWRKASTKPKTSTVPPALTSKLQTTPPAVQIKKP